VPARILDGMSRTDTGARLIHADAARVYQAMVTAEALEAWLPPEGMSGRFERFDARPGGGYRLVLRYDEPTGGHGKSTADTDVVEARFVDLEPGRRVVSAGDFVSDDPAFSGTMTMHWELEPIDGGTLVTIRAEGVPSGISAEDHAAGFASSLAQLAAYVEAG